MNQVNFPHMRAEIVGALEALADPAYQQRVWVERQYPTPQFYDDLDMNIHTLFDDTAILPDPAAGVGAYIWEDEVYPLEELGRLLSSLIDDLDDADTGVYMSDPRWPVVVDRAAAALQVFRAREANSPESKNEDEILPKSQGWDVTD